MLLINLSKIRYPIIPLSHHSIIPFIRFLVYSFSRLSVFSFIRYPEIYSPRKNKKAPDKSGAFLICESGSSIT
jgi:hypothetical protein